MAPNGQKPLIKYVICLLLAGITLAAFAGVANAGFITFDDRSYVVEHPAIQDGFSWKSFRWALTTFDSGNWHPLTWLSLMLDYQLFGLNPAGYHLINLAFHIANTVLLFLLLEHLTARLWPSAFVALLFGIHPMHVESVAWVSERKDVLSALFFLLTLITYARYVNAGRMRMQADEPVATEKSASQCSPARRWLFYALTLLFFALGLLSKPMVVTLPFVLLLLDFWPLQRFTALSVPKQIKGGAPVASKRRDDGSRRSVSRRAAKTGQHLLAEKIPFLILSALACYFTFLAQRNGGAVRQATVYPILLRVNHLSVSYAWYILKLFWPVHLSVFYPLWTEIFGFDALFAFLALVSLTLLAFRTARKYPYFLFGWLWFLGMLVPVIGLVQVGSQAYADRYTYLPYIGLFIILAWGIPDFLASAVGTPRLASGATTVIGGSSADLPPGVRAVTAAAPLAKSAVLAILGAGVALIAIACFVRTVQEVGYWKDGLVLFERAIALDPKNESALTLLGAEYSDRREDAKALDCMDRALTLSKKFYLAWQYIGFIRAREGDYARAAQAYQTALQYTRFPAIRMDIYNNLGQALKMSTNDSDAISAYQSSLAISSAQPKVQAAVGQCLLESKQPEQAAAAFQAAIDLDPNNAGAQFGLGMCLASAGRDAEAQGHFRAALQADTNSVMALNNLAWTLAADADPSLRDGHEAVQLAERACQLTHYQEAQSIGTLAAAYAEAGRFDDAIAAARKAHDVALARGEKDIADQNAQLLKLYEAHKPFHVGESR